MPAAREDGCEDFLDSLEESAVLDDLLASEEPSLREETVPAMGAQSVIAFLRAMPWAFGRSSRQVGYEAPVHAPFADASHLDSISW